MVVLLKAVRPLGVGRLSITSWCIVISYRCCSEDRSEKLKLEQVFDRWMDKGGLVFLLKYFNWHISCSTADVKLGPIHWTISFSWLTWPREVEMLSSHQPRYLGIAPSTTRYINFLENETWDNWTCTTRWSFSFSKSLSCNAMEQGLIEIACVNSTYP